MSTPANEVSAELQEARRDPVGSVANILDKLGDEANDQNSGDNVNNGQDTLKDGVVEHPDTDDIVDDATDQDEVDGEEEGEDTSTDGDNTEDGNEAEDDATDEDGIELDPAVLAAALGIDTDDLDVDDDGRLVIRTKVDGQEAVVSMADLRKGYQLEASTTRKSQEVAEARKALDAEREQLQAQMTRKMEYLDTTINAEAEAIKAEFEAVDWAKLETENPTQYAIQRSKFGDRWAAVQQKAEDFAAQREELAREQQQEAVQQFNEKAKEEKAKLIDSIDEWSDETVRTKEGKEMAKYLASQGYSKDEIVVMIDHRALQMVRKAMLYDRVKPKVGKAKKTTVRLPKVSKPGTGSNQQKASTRKRAEQKEAALKGDERAKVKFVRETLLGGSNGRRQSRRS